MQHRLLIIAGMQNHPHHNVPLKSDKKGAMIEMYWIIFNKDKPYYFFMSLFVPHSVTIVISQTVSGVTFFGLNLNNIALYKEFHIRKKTDHLFFLCIPASFGCYSLLKISLGNLYQKIRYLSNLFVADTPMKENENRSTPSQNNFKYEIANHT